MCSKNKEYNIVTSYSPEALFISSFALVFPMHFTESELKYAEYTAVIFSVIGSLQNLQIFLNFEI